MKCPFELPVEKDISTQFSGKTFYRIIDANKCSIAVGLTEKNADYIVQTINSHEKLVEVVRHLVSSATKYPEDYATKDLNKLIPYLIKEAKQALKEAE